MVMVLDTTIYHVWFSLLRLGSLFFPFFFCIMDNLCLTTALNSFTLPVNAEQHQPLWETMQQNAFFCLQRTKFGRFSFIHNVVGTVQSVYVHTDCHLASPR